MHHDSVTLKLECTEYELSTPNFISEFGFLKIKTQKLIYLRYIIITTNFNSF